MGAIFECCLNADIDLPSLELETVLVLGHRLDDLLAQATVALVLDVDAVLEPFAHVLFAVVTGFHGQVMLTKRFGPQHVDAAEVGCAHGK